MNRLDVAEQSGEVLSRSVLSSALARFGISDIISHLVIGYDCQYSFYPIHTNGFVVGGIRIMLTMTWTNISYQGR